VLLSTISLDAARRAGDASLGVEDEGIVNGQGKIAVAAGRDRSRRVVVFHGLMITRRTSTCCRLSPSGNHQRTIKAVSVLELPQKASAWGAPNCSNQYTGHYNVLSLQAIGEIEF
jgi:hypothetical protein